MEKKTVEEKAVEYTQTIIGEDSKSIIAYLKDDFISIMEDAYKSGYNDAKQEFIEALKNVPEFRKVIKDTFIEIFKGGITILHDPIPGLITPEDCTYLEPEIKEYESYGLPTELKEEEK